MDIDFELYKVFYYVSKYLSFSEASNHLYISQSAVSQSIKQLEKMLDCTLFFRNTKRVKLTHEGEILKTHVEQAFNLIKTAERSIGDIDSMKKGEIRIASSDTICKYYLLPFFKRYNKEYPNIKIHITNRTSPKCMELLKNGSVDFAVVNLPEKVLPIFEVKKKTDMEDVFIGGPNHLELKGRKIEIKELLNYPILVLEKNTVTRDYFDRLQKDNNVILKPEVELGSIDLLIEMTLIGLGISFVPSYCIKDREDIFIIDLKEEIKKRSLGVITQKSFPLSKAAQKFIEILD